jgi:hypothetical protein
MIKLKILKYDTALEWHVFSGRTEYNSIALPVALVHTGYTLPSPRLLDAIRVFVRLLYFLPRCTAATIQSDMVRSDCMVHSIKKVAWSIYKTSCSTVLISQYASTSTALNVERWRASEYQIWKVHIIGNNMKPYERRWRTFVMKTAAIQF